MKLTQQESELLAKSASDPNLETQKLNKAEKPITRKKSDQLNLLGGVQ